MSVISLSSDDEVECVVLDSDDEYSGKRPLQTHQVFIVEGIPNFNQLDNQSVDASMETEERCSKKESNCITSQSNKILDALQSTSKSLHFKESEIATNCLTLPITSCNEGKKSESALKVLAEKLSQVFSSNNCSNVALEQFDTTNHEPNLSSLEKTILDVSKGFFTMDNGKNELISSYTTDQNNRNGSKIKDTKIKKKKTIQTKINKSGTLNSYVEISKTTQVQSTYNQTVPIVSEANSNMTSISPQGTNFLKIHTDVRPSQSQSTINQPKRRLKTGEKIKTLKNPSSSKRINKPSSPVEPTFLSESKHVKSRKTRSPELESINQTNGVSFHDIQNKNLEHRQKHRIALKSKNKSPNHTKLYKPYCPEFDGPYDNKLKFTFDKSVSVYSVSVVSPSEPRPSRENINVCPFSNDVQNIELSCSSGQKSIQHLTEDLEVTRAFNKTSRITEDESIELQNVENVVMSETLDSDGFRGSPIPFYKILDLKSSFYKHYNIVFDDKTDKLCVEMGNLLLQTIEESKNLLSFMETRENDLSKANRAQQSQNLLFRSDGLNTAVQTCQDSLQKSKRKFIDNFSKIHDQINRSPIVGTQLKIVLLTAWFMKMFLSIITSDCPDCMEILQKIKIKALDLLSEEIVRWPLICKTFIKDEHQFVSDCLLVLEFIKNCLNDQTELNSTPSISSTQIHNSVKPQSIACITSIEQVNERPRKLQNLTNTSDNEESVIMNDSTKIDTTNCTYSEDNAKEVFQSNQKRKKEAYSSKSLNKYTKINNTHRTTYESQKPKRQETNENCQHRIPPSLVPIEDKTREKPSGNVAKPLNNIPKTNTGNDVLSSTVKYSSKETKKRLTNTVLGAESGLCYQPGISPEIFNKANTQDNMTGVSINVQSQTQSNRYPQEKFNSSLQSQPNNKEIQNQYLKEQISNKKLINQHIKINDPTYSHIGQELDQKMNLLYVQGGCQLPQEFTQSNESDVSLIAQSENLYQSNYTLNTHAQQNVQYNQSYQPNLNKHDYSNTATSNYLQNEYQYSNQAYFQESSVNKNQPTTSTILNSFQDAFPKFSGARNSSMHPFPAQSRERIEISSCPIAISTPDYSVCDFMGNTGVTINNYNITNYQPHISPS